MVRCIKCKTSRPDAFFNNASVVCDNCRHSYHQETTIAKSACEPHAVLDATHVDATEQIGETWACRDCANAIKFMKNQEKQLAERELQICIRFGKFPF